MILKLTRDFTSCNCLQLFINNIRITIYVYNNAALSNGQIDMLTGDLFQKTRFLELHFNNGKWKKTWLDFLITNIVNIPSEEDYAIYLGIRIRSKLLFRNLH